jgi:hypothetical protein
MNDYIRRAAKFIVYIVLIFILILGVFPLISQGKPLMQTMHELLQNSRFTLMFGLLIAYGLVYPMISFVKVKRHLNSTFDENRDKFEKAFKSLDYIKTAEYPDKIVFRKRRHLSRLLQWHEDEITVYTSEDPVIISGMRKWVLRVDRIIDQYLMKESM